MKIRLNEDFEEKYRSSIKEGRPYPWYVGFCEPLSEFEAQLDMATQRYRVVSGNTPALRAGGWFINTGDAHAVLESGGFGGPAPLGSLPLEIDPNGLDQHQPGAKLDGGKVDLDLVLKSFARSLMEIGAIGTDGAIKYSENGWLEVENGERRYSSAMQRHYCLEEIEGEIDSQSGHYHAGHVAWNALARLELMLRRKEKEMS